MKEKRENGVRLSFSLSSPVCIYLQCCYHATVFALYYQCLLCVQGAISGRCVRKEGEKKRKASKGQRESDRYLVTHAQAGGCL